MAARLVYSGVAGLVLMLSVSNAQNLTTGARRDIGNDTVGVNHEINYDALSAIGVSHEFADQFRLNLIKAIEAAKEQDGDPLRQGEFGGVSGGFYQGGGGGGTGGGGGGGVGPGGGGGGGQEEEDDYEEDEMMMMPPGPGAFGVLSGLFGIFSGLGSLNPSRIIQSTVNFFPPGQRMMAQMIVDSLIGYTPPENRTARPRPRTRRTTTTPLPVAEMITMSSGSEAAAAGEMMTSSGNETVVEIVAKDAESNNATTGNDAMSQSASIPAVMETTTLEPDFINVHEILNRTTSAPVLGDQDDESDFEKRDRIKSNVTIPNSYKLKPKPSATDEGSLNATTAVPPATQ